MRNCLLSALMNQKCMSVPGYKDKCDIMQINAQETNIKSINIKLNHEFEILFVQLRINFQGLQANEWPKKRMANFFSEWPNIKLRVLNEWPRPFT